MENKKKYKKTPFSIKITLVFFIILLYFKIGMMNSDSYTNMTYIIFYIWFLSCVVARPKTVKKVLKQKHYVALFIFLLYYFVGRLFSFSLLTSLRGTFAFLQYLFPIFMYEFYSIVNDKKTNNILVGIITCIYIYFSIKTIAYLNINPLAAREMISVGIEDTIMIGGGFSLAYGFAIISPVFIYFLANLKKNQEDKLLHYKYFKLIMISVIILFITIIIKSMFAIAFLLLVLGCLYAIYTNFKSQKSKLILLASVLFLTVLFFLIKDHIVQALISYLSSIGNSLSDRLVLLLKISDSNVVSDSGSMGERLDLYASSFYTWINNFVFGIGYQYGFDVKKLTIAGLGQHSEWFDLFAIHGLMTLFLLYYTFCRKKRYNGNMGLKIVMPVFLILGFLNPIHIFNIYFVTFCFAPMLNDFFNLPVQKIAKKTSSIPINTLDS